MKKIIVPIVLIIVLLVTGVIGYIHNDRYLNDDDSNETAVVAVYVDEDVLELMEEIYGVAFDVDAAYSRDCETFYDITNVIA